MRKLLIVLMVLMCGVAKAQFQYAGQWTVSAAGGVTQNAGYNIQLGTDHIFGLSMHGMQIRASYMDIPVSTQYGKFNTQRFGVSFNYSLLFDRVIHSPWFFVQLTAGAICGYDNVPEEIIPGVKVNMQSKFIVGLNVAPQFEFKVARKIHLYVEPRYSYLFLNAIYNYDISANVGIKVYL